MKERETTSTGAASARVRVVCSGHTHTGIASNTCFSDHAHVRARARRRKFTEAEVAAWRERIFADGLEDPVKVAVEEAVRDFGQPEDFTLWAWYANRIGVNSFLELYFEQKSVMRECRLRSPVRAFHARLQRFYAAYFREKGPSSFAKASAFAEAPADKTADKTAGKTADKTEDRQS